MSNFVRIDALSRLAFVVAIGGFSGSGMADAITTGPAGQIYWDQTRNFNLSGVADPLWHYWYTGGLPAEQYTERSTLSFLGAPADFVIAGTNYSLTGVTTTLAFSLATTWDIYCHENDSGRHCQSDGNFSSGVLASFAALSTPAASGQTVWIGAHAWDDGWGCCILGIIPYPEPAYGHESNIVQDSRTVITSYDSALSYFESQNPIALNLDKNSNLAFTYVNPEDYDDHMVETSNVWSGTATLRYTFTPAAESSVPEPSTFLLIGAGLVALGFSKKV